MKFKLFLVALMFTASFFSQSAFAEQKPLEDFFKKPQFAGFQLSPDGKNLGVLAPVENRMNLVIINLKKAVTLFTAQNMSAAAKATQKVLDEATAKFGYQPAG